MTEAILKHQSIREIAEMIATFRTPTGVSWEPLANDIETALRAEREDCAKIESGNSAHGVAMELIYPGQQVTIDLLTGETRLRRAE